MPQYIYKHPEKEEYVEVTQRMAEKHEFFDEDGLEWKRVYTVPQMSIGVKYDVFNQHSFVNATENKNYTIGDMWDRAAEDSAARAEKAGGIDPVKAKYYEKYSKDRKGAKHIQQIKEERKNFETKDVKVEY